MRLPSKIFLNVFSILVLSVIGAFAQAPTNEGIDTSQPTGITVDEIIRKFTEKEKAFAKARNNYVYRRSVKIDTFDDNGSFDGEYQEVVDITYNDKGVAKENVVFAPQNTVTRLLFDQEDFDDIRKRYPFVLTSDDVNEYQILFVGKQRLDELDTFVFDLAPKHLKKDERKFQGRIWVDQQDLQIVKTQGKPAYLVPEKWIKHPEESHLFPSFTTYREQIDGKYWFPTYVKADEVLHFPGNPKQHTFGSDTRIKIVVKYSDYKYFGSSFKIQVVDENGKPLDDKKPVPPPDPAKKK